MNKDISATKFNIGVKIVTIIKDILLVSIVTHEQLIKKL